MSVTTIPRPEIVLPQDPPADVDVSVAGPQHWIGPPTPDDVDASTMLRHGALYGIPATYAVLVAVALIAAPGQPGLLLAMIWPALVGGWYFGTIAALTVFELQHQPRSADQRGRAERRHAVVHLRPRAGHA